MKTTFLPALIGALSLVTGISEASYWAPAPPPPHHYHGGYDRYDRRGSRLEARAQLRLRQLGYYRGAIDGSFGNRSRSALVRFQRDHGLRPTGWLDRWTIRALRL